MGPVCCGDFHAACLSIKKLTFSICFVIIYLCPAPVPSGNVLCCARMHAPSYMWASSRLTFREWICFWHDRGNCTHHGLRCIQRIIIIVSSCAALRSLRMLFWCCWHCDDLLCSRRLFLHLGICWGDVYGLHDCFHCCSSYRRYSVAGMLVGSGRR